jgi:hypothetical protein
VFRRWGQLRLGAGLAGPNHDSHREAVGLDGEWHPQSAEGRPMSQRLHIPLQDLADYYEAGWVL